MYVQIGYTVRLSKGHLIDVANCYVVLHVHLGVSGLSECSHPTESPGEVGGFKGCCYA
jgi:hypothetical protein